MKIKPVFIRSVVENDAEKWLELLRQLSHETNYMLYSYNDNDFTVENCKKRIASICKSATDVMIVLECEEKNIVGYALGEVSHLNKKSHILSICGGVLKTYQGGAGKKLVEHMIGVAKNRGLVKVELSIIASNKLSINLFKKMGFAEEGLRYKSIKQGENFDDEQLMGILV